MMSANAIDHRCTSIYDKMYVVVVRCAHTLYEHNNDNDNNSVHIFI